MININIEIFDYKDRKWTDYTKYASFSNKGADLLDEQLDEAEFNLMRVKKEYFMPLTRVRVTRETISNGLYSSAETLKKRSNRQDVTVTFKNGRILEKQVKEFFIANDNAIEQPVGSGWFNHQLYLIELTKIMEGYIGDSITFTNALGNGYLNTSSGTIPEFSGNGRYVQKKSVIGSPIQPGLHKIPIKQLTEEYITWYRKAPIGIEHEASWSIATPFDISLIIIDETTKEEVKNATLDISSYKVNLETVYYFDGDQEIEFDFIENHQYLLKYEIKFDNSNDYKASIKYRTAAVGNRYPLKKWTILDVVNRINDVIIPIKKGDNPKFRLEGVNYNENGNVSGYDNGSIAEKLENILAPEFTFTKMNLREMLQQVGGFIHAEPRVKEVIEENGKDVYIYSFDFYGSNEYSNISKKPYVTASFGTDINQYCTELDTSADNIISQLDWAQGVVTEPYEGGTQTLRTENTGVRIDEGNGVIATTKGIYSIIKVYCKGFVNDKNDDEWTKNIDVDITPYIFEQADYENLSSFSGAYPYSKSCALYYSQGAKNISGLFFKPEHVINPALSSYAIINILSVLTGFSTEILISAIEGNYATLKFTVEYLPIYSARVRTNKSIIIPSPKRAIAYNQSANLIESRYFGENLKGAIARLGNVEKTYTYNLAFLSDIPKPGTKFDKNYYISAVSTEYLPTYIKCTIALSKDFNRLSQYVGVNSNKRMWEISEKQSSERDTILTEYIKISTEEQENGKNIMFSDEDTGIAKSLFNEYSRGSPVSAVLVNTQNKDSSYNNYITLPVVSTAMGNSMLFSFSFKDNYSAGQQVIKDPSTDIDGYWGNYVSYADYYGRFYYLWFRFYEGTVTSDDVNAPLSLPLGISCGASFADGTIKYRKDSREIPSITYEITAVTDNENIIIGSGLMKNCKAVNKNPTSFQLIGLKTKIGAMGDYDKDYDVIENGITFKTAKDSIEVSGVNDYEAWAIIRTPSEEKITIEDENGGIGEQTIINGGELMLGCNDSSTTTIYFSITGDIYD